VTPSEKSKTAPGVNQRESRVMLHIPLIEDHRRDWKSLQETSNT
jgi:hypothetical protein